MLDVHPVHGSGHSLRDFVFHLVTITAGLFIALSLESGVQWLHHRHLLHQAEASLENEIRSNAKELSNSAEQVRTHQEILKSDVKLLDQFMKTRNLPKGSSLEVSFNITQLDDLSWKTAQSTGAISYMSYAQAREYAEIYSIQETLDAAEKQAARDAILAIGPFVNLRGKDEPKVEDAAPLKQHIEVLQGQLVLVNSLIGVLEDAYKKFLTAHSK